MRIISQDLRLSATDVSNHLACHHLTTLELSVARGKRADPEWRAPDLVVLQELGLRHESRYLEFLKGEGLSVVEFGDIGDEKRVSETERAMQSGAEAIVQGVLRQGRWFGKPDILRKVSKASKFGNWSYEAYDCKLARETKATTVLQLSFYSDLLKQTQGVEPGLMWVVAPGHGFAGEPYRVAEYAAYYRYVKDELEVATGNETLSETYPEPCEHCDVCRWFQECEARRREDDHLSLVAGIRKSQRNQLAGWNRKTVAKLASMPIPLQERPLHGSREGMERVREQARVQIEGRKQNKPVHELLAAEAGNGFWRLPEPSPADMFVDLEGDPFAGDPESGGGQEYLFGFVAARAGKAPGYSKRWALTAKDEREGFEWLVDEVMRRWKETPTMHVYHFGAYEPSAFKRLMGRYATREEEVDSMLRAGVFVDLHTVLKQAVRASVEEYSLKKLEALYGFTRKTPLEESRVAMRYLEHRLQLGWEGELPEKYREAMEGYNGEDCFSTAALRSWLEGEREKKLKDGVEIPRPLLGEGAPPEDVDERQKRVVSLAKRLKEGVPEDREQRTAEEQARWLLASLLDWHRREDKAVWWEYYRLRDMKDEELLEERSALAGLKHEGHVRMAKKSPVERYSFPKQETEVRRGDKLCHGELSIGTVERVDVGERVIEIKRTVKTSGMHPTSVFVDGRGPKWEVLAESIFELGERVSEGGMSAGGAGAAWDLLLKNKPRLADGETIAAIGAETTVETACRIASALAGSVFAIQGPPGAGKTFTAARMICRLVQEGKRIGVTAHSHKAIGKLLQEVQVAADEAGIEVRCVRKVGEEGREDEIRGVETTNNNEVPLAKILSRAAHVAAGTAWMWARPEYAGAVDALFIDEGGQMALADVVAAARAATNQVLVGDPQQLQRPLKGSHPEGAERSALEHLIGDRKTILPEMGMLLPQTRRMHPDVCRFTSEVFYEDKLKSHPVTRPFVLEGHTRFKKPGLYFVPASHEGNQNSSLEEVEIVARIVESLLKPEVKWFYGEGKWRALKREEDILLVAPYNAQVSDLAARLPGMKIGTVDKFQGQEAPVVIYSMTTSSPEEAPRGMEFLYSLNRLNVATSRAKTAVIVVGSTRLFEPECRSPRQMQLANALCRYRELASTVDEAKL